MIRKSTPSPCEPSKAIAVNHQFRVGLIPATVVGFIGCIAVLYAWMIVQNVVRDAMNGYDSRYLILASLFPALLFGFGTICFAASFELKRGRWREALKINDVIAANCNCPSHFRWISWLTSS